jgi:hypothetical protein
VEPGPDRFRSARKQCFVVRGTSLATTRKTSPWRSRCRVAGLPMITSYQNLERRLVSAA